MASRAKLEADLRAVVQRLIALQETPARGTQHVRELVRRMQPLHEKKRKIEQALRELNPGAAGSAFKRCVRAVTAKGGAISPRGVCASAGRKKYGKKRFQKMAAAGRRRAERRRGNPTRQSYAEWVAAIPLSNWYTSGHNAARSPRWSSAAEAFRSYSGANSKFGPIASNAPANYKRQMKKRFFAGYKAARAGKLNPKRRGRRNPAGDAAAVYEEFHGRPATRERVYSERVHEHTHLADLGELVKLRVSCPGVGVFDLEPKGVRVATSEQSDKGRRQLYFVGGDQRMTAAMFPGFSEPWKDHVDLGEAVKIWYFTTKDFHNFEPTVYHHKFAEEGGTRPSFHYDTLSDRFYITGGSYSVERDGIRN